MKIEKNTDFFHMIISSGNVEILKKLLKSQKPTQFKELKTIVNPRTCKKYSSRTISKSVKILENENMIKNEVIKKSKPKTSGYKITEKGIESFYIIKEAEEKYKKL